MDADKGYDNRGYINVLEEWIGRDNRINWTKAGRSQFC